MTLPSARRHLLLFTTFLLLVTIACEVTVDFEGFPTEESVPSTGRGGEWYTIYFTDPDCPPEEERSGGLDETIAADIRQAEFQVDVAAFDFDATPMIDALIALEERSLPVRIVTDEENEDMFSIRRLRRNGLSVITDDRSALMHNKFVVVDGRYLWTGSLNFTSNGVYCNNNNVVRIDSPELAANYRAEMDEMVEEGSFGPTSPADTPNEKLRINDVLVENYFASETEVAPIIGDAVSSAQEEILFLAFSFTHEAVGEAMLARAEAGVTVRGVFETVGSETPFSYYPVMADAGLTTLRVRQDGNPRLMHHKVIIVDRETVIFGSFNFSGNANDNNDENVLIVHDPAFAEPFVDEFFAVWQEAE